MSFPLLNAPELSRCEADPLAGSGEATNHRLAKLIRRTRRETPDNRAAALVRLAPDWETRVSAVGSQCRGRSPSIGGD